MDWQPECEYDERVLDPFIRVAWELFQLSGLRWVWLQFEPDRDPIPWRGTPSTGLLWLVGVYTALFGLASGRYEAALDRIENRQATIFAQLGSASGPLALERIPGAQLMVRPTRPSLFAPASVVRSLIGEPVQDPDNVEELTSAVVTHRRHLSTVSLGGINLVGELMGDDFSRGVSVRSRFGACEGTIDGNERRWDDVIAKSTDFSFGDLSSSGWSSAVLQSARFFRTVGQELLVIESDLSGARFTAADLSHAQFITTCLRGTNFQYSRLVGARFTFVDVTDVSFHGANLSGAEFRDVDGLEQDQLDVAFIRAESPATLPAGFTQPPARLPDPHRTSAFQGWYERLVAE